MLWISTLNNSSLLYFSGVLQMMNMQICSCSAILAMTNCLHSPKSPELHQSVSLKYGHRSRGWELDTKSVGRPSKGELLCPLPHCGVEITVGTCTETDLKLQASIHTLQSEACRQQDWHHVPSPPTREPWSHKLLLLRCSPVSVAHKPCVFYIQNIPTNLIHIPFQLNTEYSFFQSFYLAIWCQFVQLVLSEVCFKVLLCNIMFGLPCFWGAGLCSV